MGVAEFTVFLTGEGTRRDRSSRVRCGCSLLQAWCFPLCGLFSGKVHCCYRIIYHHFPLFRRWKVCSKSEGLQYWSSLNLIHTWNPIHAYFYFVEICCLSWDMPRCIYQKQFSLLFFVLVAGTLVLSQILPSTAKGEKIPFLPTPFCLLGLPEVQTLLLLLHLLPLHLFLFFFF